jgi:hypothetical protein
MAPGREEWCGARCQRGREFDNIRYVLMGRCRRRPRTGGRAAGGTTTSPASAGSPRAALPKRPDHGQQIRAPTGSDPGHGVSGLLVHERQPLQHRLQHLRRRPGRHTRRHNPPSCPPKPDNPAPGQRHPQRFCACLWVTPTASTTFRNGRRLACVRSCRRECASIFTMLNGKSGEFSRRSRM